MGNRGTGAIPTPLVHAGERVRSEWVDYNGHMNVAYYVLVFDHASDGLLDHLHIGEAYRHADDAAMFVVEAHVTYDREVHEGAPLCITTQVLDYDPKRLHVFHRMYHADDGSLVATNELMFLHVDLKARRSTPLPADALARVETLARAHAGLERPPRAGHAIGLGRSGSS